MADNDRKINVVFLSPRRWDAPPDSDAAVAADPQGNTLLLHLHREGVKWRLLNPLKFPWNPLGLCNSFISAIDPFRALYVLLFMRKVDAVISVSDSGGLLLLLLRRMFFFKPKIILRDTYIGHNWRLLSAIQRIVFPRYDGFMMLTTSQENYLRGHYRIRGKIATVYYNINEEFYRPTDVAVEDYILSVGDDISRDYPTLMQAAKICKSRFVVKSKWKPSASPEDNKVPENVTFITERLEREEYRGLYEKAKMVVLPLHDMEHAGGITTLFESMAMGKALVVTRCNLSRDFVIDGENALVVEPGDATALAAAVERLEGDAQLRRKLGQNARKLMETKLSTSALAKRTREFILQVCEEG